MSGINKAIGLLVFAVVAIIVFNVYMGVQTTSNQTGWSAMMTQSANSWIPMLLVAVVVITIVLGLVVKRNG
jgi:hypothetical protein